MPAIDSDLGWILTCDSTHSWYLYSVASFGVQATGIRTQFLTKTHYPDTELISPCPILVMQSARIGSNTYQFWTQLGFELWTFEVNI